MKVYIGADHNGYHMRGNLAERLRGDGYDVIDDGDKQLDPADDYPVFAQKVVADILSSKDTQAKGILICGSGQGMCMAANRFKGIRAALIYDDDSAMASRNDDDSNIACIAARYLSEDDVYNVVKTWLETPFAGAPRFKRRINELDEL